MPKFTLEVEGENPVSGDITLTTFQQYYRVRHDREVGGVRNCAPCPEVFRLGDPDNNLYSPDFHLTAPWQFFSFALFAKVAYEKTLGQLSSAEYSYLAQKWTALMAGWVAFTNGSGSDTNHNYILGTNAGKPDMAYDTTLVCGGAGLTGEEEMNSSGGLILKVDTFNGNAYPPNPYTIDPYTDPRVFFACNVQKNGSIIRFPQLDGSKAPTPLINHDVPVPLITYAPVYYPLWKLEKLPLGSSKPPYFP